MNSLDLLKYYSRRNIQKEIVRTCKNREVAIKYGDKGYGKRPDSLQFENDVLELAKKGATSFSISVEHWQDPFKLDAALNKQQLDVLRTGWDFLIDVDSSSLEYSKVTAALIIDALKIHKIKNFSIKYSGNRGFHIAIPYQSFPDSINNQETRLLFPDGAKTLASYLKYFILDDLRHELKNPNPFSLVDIDNIMFSSRHLFRSPYSINEKSGLVSIPINPEDILSFNPVLALPENVDTRVRFLPELEKSKEAAKLFVAAFDWQSSSNRPIMDVKARQEDAKKFYTSREKAIFNEDLFPPCIKLGMLGLDDGKKRFVFIAINFLKNMGWKIEDIESRLLEWNKHNKKPLPNNYITSQIHWFKRQKKLTPPPNCNHQSYMLGIGICKPDNFCKFIKNPVSYPDKRLALLTNKAKKQASSEH